MTHGPEGECDDTITGHGPGEGRSNDDEAALQVYAAPPTRYAAGEERSKSTRISLSNEAMTALPSTVGSPRT